MVASDVGPVPEDCHGSREALLGRIEDLGGAAMLAFDGEQHVAQLQFRRYDPMCRSAKGIWQPDYWGDFGEHAPKLPEASVNVFCYHVGQLSAGEERSPDYQGRGIGLALLDHFLDWAASREFAGVVYSDTSRSISTLSSNRESKDSLPSIRVSNPTPEHSALRPALGPNAR
tara:strand:- start:385 stop:900 length:516 start_codon:yes stop_codon:yes gene_type:complete